MITITIPKKNRRRNRKRNKNKNKNESKVRVIEPDYYYENEDENEDGHGHDDNVNGDDEDMDNNNGGGNKMAISGTMNRHNFKEWSTKHVNRLHDYNMNLGNQAAFEDVRLGNKAYNSFRRDLEKQGFKKFAQPTPVDKK